MGNYFKHSSSFVDEDVAVGEGTKIWHFSHIQKGARIGKNCILGQNINVGSNVVIGNFCKIQNNVSSMVFTNILNPRCKYPQAGSEFYIKTLVKEGASIGANATIVCGHTIGKHAMIGAGSVVTKDVPDFALVVGNPARVIGWYSEAGEKLIFDKDGIAKCERSGKKYKLENNLVVEI